MKKENLTHEEDYIIQLECEDCGEFSEDVSYNECETCGSTNVIPETSHEGVECKLCKQAFDMWEDAYIDKTDFELVCESCYNDLGNLEG